MEAITTTKIFLRHDDDILLLQRSFDDPIRPGELDLPGGQVETDEDVFGAASRELREETGQLLGRGALLLAFASTIVNDERRLSITRQFMIARTTNRTLRTSAEHGDGLWVPEQQLACVMTHVPHLAAYWHVERFGLWQAYDNRRRSRQAVES